jgi:hypothetical protein
MYVVRLILFRPQVPSPCILSSRECGCGRERAAPFMLIPPGRSGVPAGVGRSERAVGEDFAFEPCRPRPPGERRCGCVAPIRNNNDGVSPSATFRRFVAVDCCCCRWSPSSTGSTGVDVPSRGDEEAVVSLGGRRWRVCWPRMVSFCCAPFRS